MRTDELHEHAAEPKRYVHDQPVFVATEIKDGPIVAHEVDSRTELPLDFGWICPMRFSDGGEPGPDRTLGVRVTRPEQLECPPGDHLQQSYLVTNLVTMVSGRTLCLRRRLP
jgi:hypothetical protein